MNVTHAHNTNHQTGKERKKMYYNIIYKIIWFTGRKLKSNAMTFKKEYTCSLYLYIYIYILAVNYFFFFFFWKMPNHFIKKSTSRALLYYLPISIYYRRALPPGFDCFIHVTASLCMITTFVVRRRSSSCGRVFFWYTYTCTQATHAKCEMRSSFIYTHLSIDVIWWVKRLLNRWGRKDDTSQMWVRLCLHTYIHLY